MPPASRRTPRSTVKREVDGGFEVWFEVWFEAWAEARVDVCAEIIEMTICLLSDIVKQWKVFLKAKR